MQRRQSILINDVDIIEHSPAKNKMYLDTDLMYQYQNKI